MGLDLAELVHELKLVDANVAAPVSGSEVLPVRGDADAADTVALVVQGVLRWKMYFGDRMMVVM